MSSPSLATIKKDKRQLPPSFKGVIKPLSPVEARITPIIPIFHPNIVVSVLGFLAWANEPKDTTERHFREVLQHDKHNSDIVRNEPPKMVQNLGKCQRKGCENRLEPKNCAFVGHMHDKLRSQERMGWVCGQCHARFTEVLEKSRERNTCELSHRYIIPVANILALAQPGQIKINSLLLQLQMEWDWSKHCWTPDEDHAKIMEMFYIEHDFEEVDIDNIDWNLNHYFPDCSKSKSVEDDEEDDDAGTSSVPIVGSPAVAYNGQ